MHHLTRVAPELPVANLAQALDHYERHLGFATVMTMPSGDYAIVERDGVALHLYEDTDGRSRPHAIHIFATGLDELEAEAVLNGIAYDAAGDRLFVTGKLWPTLFEIELTRRP